MFDHPFPPKRPPVTITESKDRIYEVDCPELQWWFAAPRLGEHCVWVAYDSLTHQIEAVRDLRAEGTARINGIECVKLRVEEFATREDFPIWHNPVYMYTVLDDCRARWVSIVTREDGRTVTQTEGEEYFDDQWGGTLGRKLVDDGRYVRQPDGSYITTENEGIGAGTYDVTIGENTFHCLRVLEPLIINASGGELTEAYVNRDGRTVFHRRYDSQYFRGGDLASKWPDNHKLVIDDVVWVHHDCSMRAHDTITTRALVP